MNPAISNLVMSLVLMQLLRKVNFEDPDVLFITRVGYVASQLICVAVYYYASVVIKRKNDTNVLKYVEPKAPFSQDAPVAVTTTVRDYDLTETSKGMRGVLMGVGMMAFMHLYLGYVQPLAMQGIMPIKALYDSKIIQIHLFGKPAVGDLKRPFEQAPSLFAPAAKAGDTSSNSSAAATKKIE